METFIHNLKASDPKNFLSEYNRIVQEYHERGMSFCTKKCLYKHFRKPTISQPEDNCMKHCYEILNDVAYDYFGVINDYKKNK